MEKKTIYNLIILIVILINLGTCIYIYTFLKSNAKDCMTNPLIYGANLIGDKENSVECSCFEDTKYGLVPIYFNKTSVTIKEIQINPYGIKPIDMGK